LRHPRKFWRWKASAAGTADGVARARSAASPWRSACSLREQEASLADAGRITTSRSRARIERLCVWCAHTQPRRRCRCALPPWRRARRGCRRPRRRRC
jgi:hypothetical protein